MPDHIVPRLPPEGVVVRELPNRPERDLFPAPTAPPRSLRMRVPRFVARRLFRDYDPERGDVAQLEIRRPRR